jgi:hypothetical protein
MYMFQQIISINNTVLTVILFEYSKSPNATTPSSPNMAEFIITTVSAKDPERICAAVSGMTTVRTTAGRRARRLLVILHTGMTSDTVLVQVPVVLQSTVA